jgi:sugar-specific transcriptional regulator TrmB
LKPANVGGELGLSAEEVLKKLVSLGLTRIDAKIYVCLAKRGAQKGRDIRKALRLTKQQLYPSLKKLQNRGIVSSTLEHPARFSAISFERVLDLFIKAKVEETKRLQQSKKEILSKWELMDIAEPDTQTFMVIEGRNYIFSRIRQMMEETKNQISAITTVPSLVQADQYGLFDTGFGPPLNAKIQFRFLTELTEQSVNAMKAFLVEAAKAGLNLEGRNPELGLRLFPQMLIQDEEAAIFFIAPWTNSSLVERNDVGLWTNCKSLVQAFWAIFDELWRNSTDIEKKIIEIETGKPTPKTYVMTDVETAKKKYHETLQSAKEEIMLMTTSKGLIEHWKHKELLEKWAKSGACVKIMAPIVRENSEAAEELLKVCAVRHVPENYLVTTMVDGKHLFQFKTPPSEQEKLDSMARFENTFYTNEFEYVEKMKTTLNDIWKNAQTPSPVGVESIIGPYGPTLDLVNNPMSKASGVKLIDMKPAGAITEKEVLNKIVHAQKIPAKDPAKEVSRMYASIGIAVIHPPDYFNLHEMMIQVQKIEKQSTFGAEDALMVYLWLETPSGYAYVPVATVGDSPNAQSIRKVMFASTPAGRNVQLVKKDELQVRVHGNTMFAGWTVPIPLYPPSYLLPPACLLIEGYGNVKTAAVTLLHSEGFKSEIEENYFDAFVTFMHPSSKYSGPGTDGCFARDVIMTKFPNINEGKT